MEKAFDRISREGVQKVLQTWGVDKNTKQVLKYMYKDNNNIVRTNTKKSKEFMNQ